MDFSYYNKLNQLNMESSHQARIQTLRDNANALAAKGIITGYEVKVGTFLMDKAIINFDTSKEVECLIEFERMKEKIYNSNSRSFRCAPRTVKTGDYVTHIYDNNRGLYLKEEDQLTYIVRSMVDPKMGYDQTFIIICQQTLSFLDKNNKIVTYPVNFNDSRTRMAETFEKSALVDDGSTYEMYVQDNENTRRICQSDEFAQGHINRMIIKGRAYKVIGVDDVSMNGIICVKLKTDKVSPMDNMKDGIADYYRYVEKSEPLIPSALVITGDSEIILGEGDSTYTINADENQGQIVKWSINDIKGVTLIVDSNNSVRISVQNSITLKGKTIQLKAIVDNDEYTKKIKIVNW